MIKIQRIFRGGGPIVKGKRTDHSIVYTVLRAHYTNETNTSLCIYTEENGQVLLGLKEHPEMWQQLLDSGITIEPMPELPYNERRQEEWENHPIGDQLDAILEGFETLKGQVIIPDKLLTLLDIRKGIKAKHKKPQ